MLTHTFEHLTGGRQPLPEEDPFLKVRRELEAMELPDDVSLAEVDREETLEERLRRKIGETEITLTPDEEIERRAQDIDEEIAKAARTEIPEVPNFEGRLKSLEGRADGIAPKRRG